MRRPRADLEEQLEKYKRELAKAREQLAEALEQQTGSSEVLRAISTSAGNLEPVFRAILEKAVGICGAKFGVLMLFEAGGFRHVTFHGATQAYVEAICREPVFHPSAGHPLERLAQTKRVVHIADMRAERKTPGLLTRLAGARTLLIVPMLSKEALVGGIAIYRQEVSPFSNKQIALVENFAAQAVIAIENTRLLNELRESLEQQTATADVLRVISTSPGQLEPVFQAMLANATRLCEAKFGTLYLYGGDAFRAVAFHNTPPAFLEHLKRGPIRPSPGVALGRLRGTKQVIHIADITAEPAYAERDPMRVAIAELAGARTVIAVPMLKEGELIGAIGIYRQEVRPFTEKQIELVTNFARQAVIAIENTRLLSELRESLQQQTATADVLRVISSSPGELGPVF